MSVIFIMVINILVLIINMYVLGNNVPSVKEKGVLVTHFIAQIIGRAKEENLLLEEVSNRMCHAAVTAD